MNEKLMQISSRIKELREILDLSAEYVALKSGIALDDYKAYESGDKDIPISAMYAVAAVFNVDPTVLLTGETPKMNNYTVVRGGKGIHVERCPGYSFTSLAHNFANREMEPMIVTLSKDDEKPLLITHKGDEFNYVLSGSVEVTIGMKKICLNTGDSIYFDPSIPHGQAALSNEASFLTVINENQPRNK